MIRKITKWILVSLLILLTGLFIAYWSAPYWVPSQLQQFLPQTLKLDKLEIERPGLTSAKIPKLSFAIEGVSSAQVELEDIELNYSIWNKQLTSIQAKKSKVTLVPSNKEASNFNNQISIPDIPVETIEVSQLQLSGLLVQDVLVNDLSLNKQNSDISTRGTVSLFGIQFDIATKIYSKSQLLRKIVTNVNFLGDKLSATISPYHNNGFLWDIEANLNNQSILPIDGVAPIEIVGTGYFIKDKHISIGLMPNFDIQTQVDLEALAVERQLESFLLQQNTSVDLSSLQYSAKLSIKTQQDLKIAINNDNQIEIQQGSLPLSIEHPLLSVDLNLNTLKLDANQSLSDPRQSFAGDVSLISSLPDFIYKDKTTSFSSSNVDLSLDTDFQINESLLTAKSKELKAVLSESTLKLSDSSTKLPTTQWSGDFEVVQNLLGEPKPDHLTLNLKQKKPINLKLINKSENISLDNLTNRFSLGNDQLKVITQSKMAQLELQPLTLNNIVATTNVNLSTKNINGSTSIQSIDFINAQAHLVGLSTKFHWSLLKNSLTAKGKVTQDDLTIPFDYHFNLNSRHHQVGITNSNIPALQLADWLNPILSEHPNLQVIDGSITGDNIKLDPISLAGSGQANIQSLNLVYDELSVNNITINDTLSDRAPLTGKANINIESINLASGISINDFSTSLNHRQQVYRFKDMRANLLDGSMSINKLTISPKLITPFTLKLNAINFTPLLEAFESESLFIEGKFDFVLPIYINDQGQAIKDGTFASIEAGFLKVKTAEATDTNIAFQALDNFHYSNLSGTINYSEDGIYRLKVNLAGNNPNLYDGFPIELTLNIEGNLPNLLHSMVFSGDMAKPIIDRYHSGEFDVPESPDNENEDSN